MRVARLLGMVAVITFAVATAHAQLQSGSDRLALASPELLSELKAEPFNYFRFVNRSWTERVCEMFAVEAQQLPVVTLHGDAHLEQFAFTRDAWGLDDFDDSVRGPAFIDVVRFLGSIDLAVRQREWTSDRDRLFDRFFQGYRVGLSQANVNPPVPAIVRRLRAENTDTREAFLAWGESKMEPLTEASRAAVITAMEAFSRVILQGRSDLAPDYFDVTSAGALRIGIGSASATKVLIRVRGPSADPMDDELLEAKAAGYLGDLPCVEAQIFPPAVRIIDGSQQLGRLKHTILAAGPEIGPDKPVRGVLGYWWIRSWDSSYHEVHIRDLASVEDLGAIVYDSGVQLGAGSIHDKAGASTPEIRNQALASLASLEPRLRSQSLRLVEELLDAWEEVRKFESAP